MDIGALPRRCRPFSIAVSGRLKSRTKRNTGVRAPISPSAHEKPVFVVGYLSLGLCHVLKINYRNYGSQTKKNLGEDTSRVVRVHRGRGIWLSVLA